MPDSDWVRKLFMYIQQYLNIIHQLSPEQCDQLAEALSGVFIKEMEVA